MNGDRGITSVQLMLMGVGSGYMIYLTIMPIFNSPPGNQDVWIEALLALVYMVIFALPALFLMNRFRDVGFNGLNELILGKFFGKVSSFCFVLLFLFLVYVVLLSAYVTTQITLIGRTPSWFFLLVILAPVLFAVYKGAGVIGRLTAFLVPYFIINSALLLIMGLKMMNFHVFFPVLADSTFKEINQGAISTALFYSEIPVFFVFSFFLLKNVNINKTFIKALLLFGGNFMLIIIPIITVLGIDIAQHTFDPYFLFNSQVQVFRFFEKVQGFTTPVWFSSVVLRTAFYSFMACYVLSGIFKTKTHKGFILPTTVIIYIICLIPAFNKTDFVIKLLSYQVFSYIMLPLTVGFPLILLIVYLWRRKKIDPLLERRKQERISQSAE